MDVDLFYGTSGPHDAPIVLVGEAWGEAEEAAKRPFVGSSGTELNRMLAEAGINRDDILCTNVVAARPQGNEMWRFFEPKETDDVSRLRGLSPGTLVQSEIRRLYSQMQVAPRRLIIASGNYSLWALTNHSGNAVIRESNNRRIPIELQTWVPTGITTWRGSMLYTLSSHDSIEYSSTPLLPIIHPAAILRDWSQRAITVHDLRTRVPMALRGDWRPKDVIFNPLPNYNDVLYKLSEWLDRARKGEEVNLAEDIETRNGMITCLGFADSPKYAICIPFIKNAAFDSYWPAEQEAIILRLIRAVNSHPNIKIVGQNFIYDTQYIQHWMGVTPRLDFDTMLAQNVLFPGIPKGLDYIASMFCEYYWYWKDDGKEWDGKGGIEKLLEYNCQDCVNTWEAAHNQKQMLRHLNLWDQWLFKKEINDLCLRMMNRGIRFDTARRAELSLELSATLNELYRRLEYIIPQDFVPEGTIKGKKSSAWYRSPKQTQAILHEVLGLPFVMNRKTGRPTSGKEARNTLRQKFSEWRGLFDLLGAAETLDTTHTVINMKLDRDGRARCSFNPAGTETHRLSSSTNAFGRGTNLQNLSKGKGDDD